MLYYVHPYKTYMFWVRLQPGAILANGRVGSRDHPLNKTKLFFDKKLLFYVFKQILMQWFKWKFVLNITDEDLWRGY